jgi:hypothetical protein
MKKIPKKAMPVVEILRRDVARPKAPILLAPTYLGWKRKKGFCCPMGLHRKSYHPWPRCDRLVGSEPFKGAGIIALRAFASWFDGIYSGDADKVVDAIWGPK